MATITILSAITENLFLIGADQIYSQAKFLTKIHFMLVKVSQLNSLEDIDKIDISNKENVIEVVDELLFTTKKVLAIHLYMKAFNVSFKTALIKIYERLEIIYQNEKNKIEIETKK